MLRDQFTHGFEVAVRGADDAADQVQPLAREGRPVGVVHARVVPRGGGGAHAAERGGREGGRQTQERGGGDEGAAGGGGGVHASSTAAGAAGCGSNYACAMSLARRQPAHEPMPALRTALLGLAVNTVLAGAKFSAGVVGHSYALIADSLESFTDIAASLITSAGIRYGSRPPDPEHPYGHGRAEALAALVVCALLLGAGVWIAVEAVREIRTPHHAPAPWTLIVLLVVVVVKETVFRVMRRVAEGTGSTAVHADAWHNRADAVTSAAAAVGITVALLGGPGWESADDWAALAAAAVVLSNAWSLLQRPWHELMDRQDPALLARVRGTALRVPGVADVEKLFARKSGPRVYVDMHLHVDPEMSVREAHAITGRVKSAVREGVPGVVDVLIHVEPADERKRIHHRDTESTEKRQGG